MPEGKHAPWQQTTSTRISEQLLPGTLKRSLSSHRFRAENRSFSVSSPFTRGSARLYPFGNRHPLKNLFFPTSFTRHRIHFFTAQNFIFTARSKIFTAHSKSQVPKNRGGRHSFSHKRLELKFVRPLTGLFHLSTIYHTSPRFSKTGTPRQQWHCRAKMHFSIKTPLLGLESAVFLLKVLPISPFFQKFAGKSKPSNFVSL